MPASHSTTSCDGWWRTPRSTDSGGTLTPIGEYRSRPSTPRASVRWRRRTSPWVHCRPVLRQAMHAGPPSPDFDRAGLGLFDLLKSERQDAVVHRRRDLFLIDPAR